MRGKMAYPQWLLANLMIGFILSSLLLLSPATRAQNVSAADCATGVHAILARGQGAGNDLDVLSSIQSLLLENINGSTSIALPYAYNSSDKVAAVHNGALLLQEYVQEYVSSCPDSKIFLLGYSLGAVLMMDALCGTSSALLWPVDALDRTYSENIIMAVAYGDETYVPYQSWNDGTCKVGIGGTGKGSAENFHPKWEYSLRTMSASKPTIILVHGAFHDSKGFEPLAQCIGDAGYNCIYALDMPGLGSTASLADDAQVIRTAILEVLEGGNDCVVVGHSYGGIAANQAVEGLAKKQRGDNGPGVVKMVYIDANLPKLGEYHLQQFQAWQETEGIDPDEILDIKVIFRDGLVCFIGGEDYFYNDLPGDIRTELYGKLKPQSLHSTSTPTVPGSKLGALTAEFVGDAEVFRHAYLHNASDIPLDTPMVCLTARVRVREDHLVASAEEIRAASNHLSRIFQIAIAPSAPQNARKRPTKGRLSALRSPGMRSWHRKYLEYFPTTRQNPAADVSECQQLVLGWDLQLLSSITSDPFRTSTTTKRFTARFLSLIFTVPFAKIAP
ncbi:acetylxylan esterase precursor, putative [Paecilomyces variotii No. 5]|uniref:Acetylxylan esterase, putative n=1 Tax=Byssochlamys spectabilis (strain No. 5 / NBRC 109023) TaxID=1356009 RepID=V5FD27_BYSSN|nr:acetylxylan esterase precursor, putative [Paecilomyces variotii No. 5]